MKIIIFFLSSLQDSQNALDEFCKKYSMKSISLKQDVAPKRLHHDLKNFLVHEYNFPFTKILYYIITDNDRGGFHYRINDHFSYWSKTQCDATDIDNLLETLVDKSFTESQHNLDSFCKKLEIESISLREVLQEIGKKP